MQDKDPTDHTAEGWFWFASSDGEAFQIGPCATRDEALKSAAIDEIGVETPEGYIVFHITQATNPPLKIADWLRLETLIEGAGENLAESDRVASDFDDGDAFAVTSEQDKDLQERIRKACDEWQEAHGLTFRVHTFAAMRNNETIVATRAALDELAAGATVGGGAE